MWWGGEGVGGGSMQHYSRELLRRGVVGEGVMIPITFVGKVGGLGEVLNCMSSVRTTAPMVSR